MRNTTLHATLHAFVKEAAEKLRAYSAWLAFLKENDVQPPPKDFLEKLKGLDLNNIGQGAPMFFVLYFFITGLHGIHIVVGIILLSWLYVKAGKGEYSSAYYTPVDLVGLYWHIVDMIWIYLYPLYYLIS